MRIENRTCGCDTRFLKSSDPARIGGVPARKVMCSNCGWSGYIEKTVTMEVERKIKLVYPDDSDGAQSGRS